MIGGTGLALVVAVTVLTAQHGESPAGPDPTERVLSSCQTVLGPSGCVTARSGSTDLQARVSFDTASVVVLVEREADEPIERRLDFVPGDGPEQRYVAAGLLVAALAASLPAKEPRAPIAGVHLGLSSFEVVVPALGSWSLDLGFRAVPVWQLRDWAVGGEARTTFFPGDGHWGVTSGARILVSESAPGEGLWLDGGLGATFRLLPTASAVDWWLTAEGVVATTQVTVVDGQAQTSQTGTRGGGRVGTRLAWGKDRFRPWLGADLALLGPPVLVRVAGEDVAQTPELELGLCLGLRFQLLDAGL